MIRIVALLALLAVPSISVGQEPTRLNIADLPESCPDNKAQCIEDWRERFESRPMMGFSILPLKEYDDKSPQRPLRVVEVLPGTVAEEAGFRVGDLITSWNGVEITVGTSDLFYEEHRELKVGSKVSYGLDQGGVSKEITLTATPPPSGIVQDRLRRIVTRIFGSEGWEDYIKGRSAGEN